MESWSNELLFGISSRLAALQYSHTPLLAYGEIPQREIEVA